MYIMIYRNYLEVYENVYMCMSFYIGNIHKTSTFKIYFNIKSFNKYCEMKCSYLNRMQDSLVWPI